MRDTRNLEDLSWCADDGICHETGERHRVDPASLAPSFDGETLYLDCNCMDCGKSGCIASVDVLDNEVQW